MKLVKQVKLIDKATPMRNTCFSSFFSCKTLKDFVFSLCGQRGIRHHRSELVTLNLHLKQGQGA